MSDAAQAIWVVGSYRGEQAKSVLAHAHAGVGSYQIMDSKGSKQNPEVVVAFLFVPDPRDGIPEHLIEVVDPLKIQKFERKRLERSGHRQQPDRGSIPPKRMAEIRSLFDKPKSQPQKPVDFSEPTNVH